MKKLTTLFFVLFLSASLFAQDFNGIKFCINPGHGGYDSNDRYIPETGFWESLSNLEKGLYLRDMLESHNAVVFMTRTTNTSADDLPFSQIHAIANSNNVDYFHSIHSNAFNSESNYTLILYQGFDTQPTYPDSRKMALILGPEIEEANRTTANYERGDFSFYGTGQAYLGVFKTLAMPATLSEGSFHDYIPESFRLLNAAYKKNEALAIFKSFVKFYNLTPLSTGVVAGIVRDKDQKVDYFAITSKNDQYKPLNDIKVTLEPGDLVYEGDDHNNGYFMFDSLEPGQYKLIYEAKDYYKDSSTVTVTANNISFADKFLTYDTTIAPVLVSFTPEDKPDSIIASTPITVTFNRPMNHESTESAFVISPAVEGSFAWQDENKTMVFTPALSYDKATKYTVTITTAAMSIWNVPIDNEYSFNFTTKNRNQLHLIRTYPVNNSENISTTVQVRLVFDAPVFAGSLVNRINLYNSANERLPVKNVKIFPQDNGEGEIYFEPNQPLANDETYRVVVSQGITDADYLPLAETHEINFRTDKAFTDSTVVIDNFEAISGWTTSYSNMDSLQSNLSTSRIDAYAGSACGKFKYKFAGSENGLIKISKEIENKAILSGNPKFGVWIKSDFSSNLIQYKFGSGDDNSVVQFSDTLNWTGWKFKIVEVPSEFLSGSSFNFSIIIKQNPEGAPYGIVYLDNISMTSFEEPAAVENEHTSPVSYALYQNYPNPFNPETVIRFKTPEREFVSLKVYDVLGHELATLVNDVMDAGLHSVEFDASMKGLNLSSGVYMYTLKAGGFISTKKLVLLK